MTDDAPRPLVVADKVIEADNMVSFELVDPDRVELPAFSPRSHVDVTIPGGMVRQYSLCHSPSDRHRYHIGVWKHPNGRGRSKALHETVNVGDTLQVSQPRNRFRVPRNTKRALLLARGIGVTPILSIADYLKSQSIPFELHYVFALMSPGAFRGSIEGANFSEDTKYYLEDSEQNQLLNAAALLAKQPEDRHLFICGADWWLDPIVKTATQKG
jgi:vanillate O-demethylase ferredoxin subunit